MLQPGNLFSTLTPKEIPQLKRVSKDKFWVFPIANYAKIVKQQIEKISNKELSDASKNYLKGLVDFMDNKIKSDQLIKLYENSGKEIPEKKIITDFGEILGPFFAYRFVTKRGVKNITFPTRQNYEIFDFFIQNEHFYGFSSKALTGGSNTLASKLIIERLEEMKKNSDFKKYNKEIEVLKNLTEHAMFEGVIIAFGNLIKNNVNSRGFNIPINELRKMFSGVNFSIDANKIEKNKLKSITEIGLSKPLAYANFLNRFIIESTKVPMSEKKKFQTGKLSYTSTNVVYGMIKFISSSDFDFDYIMRQCFQDLNIVKMGIQKGVPIFKMQSTVEAENTVTNTNYAFRSKAAFDRVNDKLGIQL